MSKNRSSFLKRDREAKKREKRELKQQRREDRKRGDQQPGETGDAGMIPDSSENPESEGAAEEQPPRP